MYIGNLREAGSHAIETFCEVAQDWHTSRFEPVQVAVAYGDKGQPSHSVRLFKVKEE